LRLCSALPFSLRSRGLIYPNFFSGHVDDVITILFTKGLHASLFKKDLSENDIVGVINRRNANLL
jgi:hypothetical protein